MNAGHMSTAQAIGYYAFETVAVLISLAVVGFVAVMAIGALVDRYQRIFTASGAATFDNTADSTSPLPTFASQNGRI